MPTDATAVELLAPAAQNQAYWAWVDALQDGVMWYTQVRFMQWGFADRFIVTAGQWIPF